MQEDIAKLVYPIIHHGLHLRERLRRGEELDLAAEQAALKGLLMTDLEARRWVDFGDESAPERGSGGEASEDFSRRDADRFLGIRYALVCWLDEFFILYSPWESAWNERKLEGELYGTNDRAWRFWEQAQLAATRPRADALEVFYLCVALGFRGELREQWDKLQSWNTTTRSRIAKIKEQEWPYPLDFEPPTFVPPHRGREQLQAMVLTGGIVLLLLIPVVAFFVVHRLGQ